MKQKIALVLSVSFFLGWGVVLILQKVGLPLKDKENTMNILTAAIPSFDRHISVEKIKSAPHYILASHLVRNLVKVDENLRIFGDLADKWTISSDLKNFEFRIRSGAKFSNGSPILAEHLVRSIESQMKSRSAIHFNFENIESVSSRENLLSIELKSPSSSFIYSLSHPEFGVLYPHEESKLSNESFKITSGPYALLESNDNYAALEKNKYYSSDVDYPDKLIFYGHGREVEELEDVDFYFSTKNDSVSKSYQDNNNYIAHDPHIGFTFWLSFNFPSKLSKSGRHFIQHLLQLQRHSFEEDGYWTPARQLYLPDGFGRLGKTELDNIWKEIENNKNKKDLPKQISILLYEKFPFNRFLQTELSLAFDEVFVNYYSNQKEFEEKMNEKEYDLFLMNNDFSSADLVENIKVTLNPNRPLIFSESHQNLSSIAIKAENSEDLEQKQNYLKMIEASILENANIVPVAYMNVKYFAKKDLDISRWSMAAPEISFWKAQWK